ncbi:S8 family serine peptidase [Paludibacterium paludis]|uniref:Peptidase S8/S53 domain-containing protein n=1 Tax=Paludibacterium paludis TaxID=1225769 RepID=A0A918UAI9_9NEIS|nr:S8 family serine peptidase [Paludibacterium paludis]GGY19114.1 hypothetical protein GCM10011289_23200 [Paludibacterium paludis]
MASLPASLRPWIALACCLQEALSAAPPPISASDGPPRQENRFMIRFKPGTGNSPACDPARFGSLARRTGWRLQLVRPMSGDTCVVRAEQDAMATPDTQTTLLAAIGNDPQVLVFEPDQRAILQAAPGADSRRAAYPINDPAYLHDAQWYLDDPNVGINAPAAWKITPGSPAVVVAILDNGVIRDHPELAGRLLAGYDMVELIDDKDMHNPDFAASCEWWRQEARRPDCRDFTAVDGDGRDPDAGDPGNWTTGPRMVQRFSNWHGTGVAGVIGARANNGKGIVGINWHSPLLPVRIAGRGARASDIIDGLRWAAGLPVPGAPRNPTPAQVANLSLAFGNAPCPQTLQRALDDAYADTGLRAFIAAAGNAAADAGGGWPSNCQGVISVAAIARNGSLTPYSNHGAAVTLSAPGSVQSPVTAPSTGSRAAGATGGLLTYFPQLSNCGTTAPIRHAADCPDPGEDDAPDTYHIADGTSLAAPMVAATVSLMLSANRSLTAAGIRHVLTSTARPFLPVSDCLARHTCGAGMLDAGRAVEVAARLPGGILYSRQRAAID